MTERLLDVDDPAWQVATARQYRWNTDPLLGKISEVRATAVQAVYLQLTLDLGDVPINDHRRHSHAVEGCYCGVCRYNREYHRIRTRRLRARGGVVKTCFGCTEEFKTYRRDQLYCCRPCWLGVLNKARRNGEDLVDIASRM